MLYLKKASLLFFISLCFLLCNSEADTIVNYNSGWQFNYNDTWYPAAIPSCIHSDLLKNKLIEEPYYRDNENKLQWISEKTWMYKKIFEIDSELLSHQHLELNFKGLDTYADVYVNGNLLLKADNMFSRWEADCKKFVSKGPNLLEIVFHPAQAEAKKLYEGYPVKLPGEERVMCRKAQFNFGWDFAPKLITCGICNDVALHGWDNFILENVYTKQRWSDISFVVLDFFMNVRCNDSTKLLVTLTNKKSGQKYYKEVNALSGTNTFFMPLRIDNPELWWCNEMGEQKFYDFSIEISDSSQHISVKEIKTGLRKIELIQEEDSVGESFYFKLNDAPVFIKGANYVPLDVFVDRRTDAKFETLLSDVKNCGMNMLRVWGGGIYEREKFYELCDEKGILVWQDFMFACGMYPYDSFFLENVKTEAEQNVKRLTNHPCMALWCGNNENSEGWHRWGWQDNFSEQQRTEISNGYKRIFNEILPEAVEKYSGLDYHESSPTFGRGDTMHTKQGDAHNWFVWHDGAPFENYEEKVPRFMSEFGFQSDPSMQAIESFTDSSDRNNNSDVMKVHQKHNRGLQIISDYMAKYFFVPQSLDDFVFMSQVVQAEGITKGIEAFRRAKPYCMGSLFWQLNDCWPAASWSSIDYNLNWKPLQYKIKKSNAPLILSFETHDDSVSVFVVNDKGDALKGNLFLDVYNSIGGLSCSYSVGVEMDLLYSKKCATIFLEENEMMNVVLRNENKDVAAEKNYFPLYSQFKLSTTTITQRTAKSGDDFIISVQSAVPARYVELSADIKGKWSDNYFDLAPGKNYDVFFTPDEKGQFAVIRIKCLNNIER